MNKIHCSVIQNDYIEVKPVGEQIVTIEVSAQGKVSNMLITKTNIMFLAENMLNRNNTFDEDLQEYRNIVFVEDLIEGSDISKVRLLKINKNLHMNFYKSNNRLDYIQVTIEQDDIVNLVESIIEIANR